MNRLVLLVEDAEHCTATLEVALDVIPGLKTHSVTTAEAALDALAEGGISALITDLHLPFLDGFELIRRVRERYPKTSLPILMISGDSDPATPALALRLGADMFFAKPYSPAAVRRKLEELLDVV